jgi:lysyl-tRNA synthetase class II
VILLGFAERFSKRRLAKSLFIYGLTVLAKALKPLPVVKTDADGKHDAFADPEQRYRRRYDLTVNDQVKETLSREPNVQCNSFF